jgi:hypothetical protein
LGRDDVTRKSLILILVLIGTGILGFTTLQQYKLDLLHAIVVNSILQKAPPAYPAERVQDTFRAALRECRSAGQEDEYLQSMVRLSQRLEKIQSLSSEELDALLLDLERHHGLLE